MRFLLPSICIYLIFFVAWQLPRSGDIFLFSTLILKCGVGKKEHPVHSTSSVFESSFALFGQAIQNIKILKAGQTPFLGVVSLAQPNS